MRRRCVLFIAGVELLGCADAPTVPELPVTSKSDAAPLRIRLSPNQAAPFDLPCDNRWFSCDLAVIADPVQIEYFDGTVLTDNLQWQAAEVGPVTYSFRVGRLRVPGAEVSIRPSG
jgi:hypothetical protein